MADEAGHKRVLRSADEEGIRADEDAGHRKRERSDVGIRISKGDYGLPRIIPSI